MPNAIQQLLRDGTADIVYLMTLKAKDVDGNSLTLYFGNRAYGSSSEDDPADQYFEPLLRQPIAFRRSLRNSERLAGRGIFRSGQAALYANEEIPGQQTVVEQPNLINAFGAMPFGALVSSTPPFSASVSDLVQSFGVDGQDVEIRWGSPDLRHEQMLSLYRAQASGWHRSRLDEVTLSLRGTAAVLDQPMMTNRYDGSGGVEGGDDLKGKPKPVGIGAKHINVPAPRLDKFSDGSLGLLAFDLHNDLDGPAAIKSVDRVSERVAEIPLDTSIGDSGDFATAADLFNADIAAGKYAMTRAEGKIRLGSEPSGLVTVDFTSKEGPAGDTLKKLVKTYGGLSGSKIDSPDFDALNTKAPGNIELWWGPKGGEITTAQALDQAVGGIEGWWGDSRQGQIRVGRLTVPSQTESIQKSFDEKDVILDSTRWLKKPDSVDPALNTIRIGHTRVYAVQDRDVANAAAASRKTLVSEEFRYSVRNQTVKRHDQSKTLTINSVLTDASDAETLGDDVLELYAPGTRLLQFRTGHKGYNLEIGRHIGLTLPRAGIDSETVFLVIGLEFDARKNEVTILCFAGAP